MGKRRSRSASWQSLIEVRCGVHGRKQNHKRVRIRDNNMAKDGCKAVILYKMDQSLNFGGSYNDNDPRTEMAFSEEESDMCLGH